MVAKPRDQEAAYQRLARELRDAVLRGRFPEGQRLPTEAELAEQYGVGRQTVRRAFHDLVAEGVVFRVPGRGTFPVTHDGKYLRQFGSVEDLMGLSIDTDMELLQPLQREIDVAAASRLRLKSDVVATVKFQRLHDGVPFGVTTVYLPPAVGKALEGTPEITTVGTVSRATIIGLIDSRLRTAIAEAEQSITATAATAAIAGQLRCAPGDPVLRIDRIYFDGDQRPVELAIGHFLPGLYSYRVRLRRGIR